MKIHGLQKMTLLDYPGKVACTVFLGGCDFRCPFCHNFELACGIAPPVMEEDELFAFLGKYGAVKGCDLFDFKGSCLLQNTLNRCTVFAYNVEIVSSSFTCPVFVGISSTEFAEGICAK